MYKVKRLNHKKYIENLAKHTAIEVRNIVLDYLIENTYQLNFTVENEHIHNMFGELFIYNITYLDRYNLINKFIIKCCNNKGFRDFSECKLIVIISRRSVENHIFNEFTITDNDFSYKMVDIEREIRKELFLLLITTSCSLINMPQQQI